MMHASSAKLVAGVLGPAAFTLAMFAGMASGVDAGTVLERAVVSLFACYLIGYAIGAVGQRAMVDAAAQLTAASSASFASAEQVVAESREDRARSREAA